MSILYNIKGPILEVRYPHDICILYWKNEEKIIYKHKNIYTCFLIFFFYENDSICVSDFLKFNMNRPIIDMYLNYTFIHDN